MYNRTLAQEMSNENFFEKIFTLSVLWIMVKGSVVKWRIDRFLFVKRSEVYLKVSSNKRGYEIYYF